jgi:hypothetical protein
MLRDFVRAMPTRNPGTLRDFVRAMPHWRRDASRVFRPATMSAKATRRAGHQAMMRG